MGAVMKLVQPKVAGRADGKRGQRRGPPPAQRLSPEAPHVRGPRGSRSAAAAASPPPPPPPPTAAGLGAWAGRAGAGVPAAG